MVLLNTCSVFTNEENTPEVDNCLLQEVEYSFVQFFEACIKPRLPGTSAHEDNYTVEKVEVGPSKERLDTADLGFNVVEVTEHFGKFVKFYVMIPATSTTNVTMLVVM